MLEFWTELTQRGHGWYWMAHKSSNGDLYHACSFASAFRAEQACGLPIYLVVHSPAQKSVASLFEEEFTEIIMAPPLSHEQWAGLVAATGSPAFGPDRPIFLHPDHNPETVRLLDWATHNRTTWIPIYRHLLHLVGAPEPAIPRGRRERTEAALSLCVENGVVEGRSAILFPFSVTWPVNAEAHFAALAQELVRRGFEVFTSVSGDEQCVKHTRPFFIPFVLLPDVADVAGWAIGIRSGAWDVLSSSRCRKSLFYRRSPEIPLWGLAEMELCKDATETSFDFVRQGPEEFCRAVLEEQDYRPNLRRPRSLSDLVGAQAPETAVSTISFPDVQRRPQAREHIRKRAASALRGDVSAVRIEDIPARDHPRWRSVTDSWLRDLLNELDRTGVRYYACRDRSTSDYFEEIEPDALLAGRYYSAAFWHTAVVTVGAELDAFLHERVQTHVAAIEIVRTGAPLSIGELWQTADSLPAINGCRPLSCGGVQLMGGWHELEPWGIWSRGLCSSFKIAFAEAPVEGFALKIQAFAAISATFPTLTFSLTCNGVEILADTYGLEAQARELYAEVPSDLVGRNRTFTFAFHFREVRSPLQQEAGADGRLLGLALQFVEVLPWPDQLRQ